MIITQTFTFNRGNKNKFFGRNSESEWDFMKKELVTSIDTIDDLSNEDFEVIIRTKPDKTKTKSEIE